MVVMDDGKLAEAVFALDATELQPGVPVEVSLHWNAGDRDVGHEYDGGVVGVVRADVVKLDPAAPGRDRHELLVGRCGYREIRVGRGPERSHGVAVRENLHLPAHLAHERRSTSGVVGVLVAVDDGRERSAGSDALDLAGETGCGLGGDRVHSDNPVRRHDEQPVVAHPPELVDAFRDAGRLVVRLGPETGRQRK